MSSCGQVEGANSNFLPKPPTAGASAAACAFAVPSTTVSSTAAVPSAASYGSAVASTSVVAVPVASRCG